MYTFCVIQFIDDGTSEYTIIKANDELDVNDELIFFYGLNRLELLSACVNEAVMEGEWKVLFVGDTIDAL